MAKFTKGGKTLITLAVAGAVIVGVFFFKDKRPAPVKAPAAPAATEQAVPAPQVEQIPSQGSAPEVKKVEEKVEAPAPVKKHTAGHAAKHAPAKHPTSTKSTPHHSSSTSTHSSKHSEEEANQKALNALANGSL